MFFLQEILEVTKLSVVPVCSVVSILENTGNFSSNALFYPLPDTLAVYKREISGNAIHLGPSSIGVDSIEMTARAMHVGTGSMPAPARTFV